MESIKINNEKIRKFMNIIIFVLLLLWMMVPVFKSFKRVYEVVILSKYYFGLMKITGIVGISLGIFCIFFKIKNAENKKDIIKECLPIFIFVLYMMWTLISCFFAPRRSQAFEGNYYRHEGYYMYLNYAGYFLCAFLINSKVLRKILLNIFVIVTIFLISVSIICLKNPEYNNIFVNNEIDSSVFAQFNHYGYFLMMTLMCCFGLFITKKNKILKTLYLIPYSILGYMLIYNNTFGCYLATIIVLIVYTVYSLVKKRNVVETLIAVTIFVILSCIVTSDGKNVIYENLSVFANDIEAVINKILNIETGEEAEKNFEKAGTDRMKLWKYGVEFIKERPIIGYGPDNLKDKYLNVGINQDRPHNLLINLAATSGIPGMILYVTAVGIIVVKGIRKFIKVNDEGQIFLIVVITYLISSMFGNSMYYTSPYFFIFLGFLMNWNLTKDLNEN